MKAKRRTSVGDAAGRATQRLNIQVDAGAYQRLLLHAMMSKESPGAIISRLIDENLRAWRVQANSVKSSDRQIGSDQASESVAELAA